MNSFKNIDDAITRTKQARASTLNTIERKLREIESLRYAYATSGDYLDQLLDQRIEVAIEAGMQGLTAPYPTPGPPVSTP